MDTSMPPPGLTAASSTHTIGHNKSRDPDLLQGWSRASCCLPGALGPIILLWRSRAWLHPPVPTAFSEVSHKVTSATSSDYRLHAS